MLDYAKKWLLILLGVTWHYDLKNKCLDFFLEIDTEEKHG